MSQLKIWFVDSFLSDLLAGAFLGIFGYYIKDKISEKRNIKDFNELITLVSKRKVPNLSALADTKPNCNLDGKWKYDVKEHNSDYRHGGTCEISQNKNGTLEFKGKRAKNNNSYVKWSSLWAQFTIDKKIRAKYIIGLDKGTALGYFVLSSPTAPFTMLKGDYHMLSPKVLFGEVTFTKLQSD